MSWLAALNITDAPPNGVRQFAHTVRTGYVNWGQIDRDIDLRLEQFWRRVQSPAERLDLPQLQLFGSIRYLAPVARGPYKATCVRLNAPASVMRPA